MKAQASVKEKAATRTGADLLVEALIEAGVDTLFGYPGGAVLPIYDAIYRAEGSFDHVLPRHEQGAIHAAEGYARVAKRPGVVIGTSGPGATNLVTGIADAMMDSIPLVIFTGQVAEGAKCSRFPVKRSSKRDPILMSKSHSYRAIFAA